MEFNKREDRGGGDVSEELDNQSLEAGRDTDRNRTCLCTISGETPGRRGALTGTEPRADVSSDAASPDTRGGWVFVMGVVETDFLRRLEHRNKFWNEECPKK